MKANFLDYNEIYDDDDEKNSARLIDVDYPLNDSLQYGVDSVFFQLENLHQVNPSEAINHLNPLIKSISIAISNAEGKDGDIEAANLLKSYFYDTIIKILNIVKKYLYIDPESTTFKLEEDLIATEGIELASGLYEFLVVYRYENIANYVYQTVITNKEVISLEYKEKVDRKDLSSKSERKKVKKPCYAVIFDQLDLIIKEILMGKYQPEEVLFAITKDKEDEWHNDVVLTALESVALPKLFTSYIGSLYNSKDIPSELIMQVRSRLVNKLCEK